ncbi:MAG: response regulator [Anaerolineae bacterium]|jgi:pilus assembly protein CpaE|nr:response regulator [Anaerolineae bacterium]MBT3712948.1 response regulator [Anaerolineae bacterium]MBT4309447.1 response regulator [Anaerolineae bacterium]MBT4458277.1 response regulator [Anaerolineae bacterium]MBT4840968.1 response regulator [Anaerolineae bacterium]
MATNNKFRVLIVDDVAETRENVRKLLQFESDVDVVGVARTGREAIEIAREIEPDVILMDINMPDMDGIAATEAIRQKSHFVQVVILSVQGDQNYMRRAMLAGARDFLTKPPMGDELISAIRRAGTMAHQERAKGGTTSAVTSSGLPSVPTLSSSQGKIITVYSGKGGTGCTTLAVNLGVALHNEETRSVIVDGNLQYGDVAVFINEQGKNTILDLATIADELDPEIVGDVMVKHGASGVHVLAAPSRPEQAEAVSGECFLKILQYLRRLYAYVIVDTPSLLTDVVLASVDESDVVVLISTQDIPAIKNTRLFLDLVSSLGVDRNRIILTINRYDKRIGITPEKISENLKVDAAAIIPLDERVVIPSVNRGVPFILGNKAQPSSRGILSLAENVRTRILSIEMEDEA